MKWKVPKDSPCITQSCMQEIGSSVCKNKCGYWDTLNQLARDGKLERDSNE